MTADRESAIFFEKASKANNTDPEEVVLPSENPWNNGMGEWWNIEYRNLKAAFTLILISVLPAVSKKRFNPFEPIIPIFQYSIIPRHRASTQSIFPDPAQKAKVSVLE